MDEIARNHDASIARVAIAWLLSREDIPSVIAGVTRLEHLEDNVRATGLALTPAELADLEART